MKILNIFKKSTEKKYNVYYFTSLGAKKLLLLEADKNEAISTVANLMNLNIIAFFELA